MNTKAICCSTILPMLLTACGTFPGKIGFENKCAKDVWVAHVEGFETEPPVGIVGSGYSAYAVMDRMRMPREVVIHWSYKWYHSDYTTKLPIDGSVKPTGNESLLFRFTKNSDWEVSVAR